MSLKGFQVQKKQCDTCIYGPRSASPASIKELEKEVADPRMKSFFSGFRLCHHSDTACCRGFWDRHKDHFAAGQIAQRLKLIDLVEHDTLRQRGERMRAQRLKLIDLVEHDTLT